MVLMLVFFTISGVMNIATVNNYLLLYEKKRTNKIEVSEVWERVVPRSGCISVRCSCLWYWSLQPSL